jgi:acyl-CoA thioesterase I
MGRPHRVWWLLLTAGVLFAAAIGCGAEGASPLAPAPPAQPTRRVVVLGDSLGVSPSLPESFPAMLQARIASQRLPWAVTNASRSGDTTAGGARRVEPLLQADVGVLVVALGANDGLQGVALTAIEENLDEIIGLAASRGIKVLLCGMETPPSHGWPYTIGFHLLFPRLAERHGVPLVPFLLEGVALVAEMNVADGIHPNAAGARRIADTVWRYLAPLLSGG